jgi:hypothetical protein
MSDSEEVFLDNGCFHCHLRPSEFGHVADGIECEFCLNDRHTKHLKDALRMPNINIVYIERNSLHDKILRQEESIMYDEALLDFLNDKH